MKNIINQISQLIMTPSDVASLVVFRVGFGLLMFWEVTRYFYFDWVEELYAKPQFHFQYEWFSWIVPFPGNGMFLDHFLSPLSIPLHTFLQRGKCKFLDHFFPYL